MTYEMIVGVHVTDDSLYTKYREAMTPLLIQHGGGFRYDFKISDVLKSENDAPINRLFAIYFKDKEQKEKFFSNTAYLEIKSKLFVTSVDSTTRISEYARD
jgi:uncharacterized protein (DUF1330 family)